MQVDKEHYDDSITRFYEVRMSNVQTKIRTQKITIGHERFTHVPDSVLIDGKSTDVAAKLLAHDRNLGERERKMVAQLGDLLDKMFTFEPEKRITVAQALAHPFITG